jgi:Heliorhodopsin
MGISLETLNILAVTGHATQAVLVLCIIVSQQLMHNDINKSTLFNQGSFDLFKTVRIFKNNFVSFQQVSAGTIEVPLIILCFFTLSACFQGFAACYYEGRAGYLHLIEYSLTASMMMMAIAAEAGISDVYFMQSSFVLMWATQILGITAELSQTPQRPYLWILPHCAGWVTCFSAYLPSIDSFFAATTLSDKQPPAYVTALLVVQIILFMSFGAVQALSLMQKAFWYKKLYNHHHYQIEVYTYNFDAEIYNIATATEMFYIILSLVAKTSLAWIILIPSLL